MEQLGCDRGQLVQLSEWKKEWVAMGWIVRHAWESGYNQALSDIAEASE